MDTQKNKFLEGVAMRHACKEFDESKKIPAEQFEEILQVGYAAPSSFGMEPTRLVVVRDPKAREEIRALCWDQRQITTASELVLFKTLKTDLLAHTNYVQNAFARKQKTPEQIAPYEAAATRYAKKPHILTPPEYNLYMLLRDLYGGRYEILAQTSLVSLVDKLNYNSYRNELFRIVDFVIADKEFSPLVVIELNDSSHLRADRRERDRKVAEILEKADLPLVTFSTEEAASSAAVRRALWRYLH